MDITKLVTKYLKKYIWKNIYAIYEKLAGCPVGPPHQHRDLPTNTDGEGDCVASSKADEKRPRRARHQKTTRSWAQKTIYPG